jgi:hypothetical protein
MLELSDRNLRAAIVKIKKSISKQLWTFYYEIVQSQHWMRFNSHWW